MRGLVYLQCGFLGFLATSFALPVDNILRKDAFEPLMSEATAGSMTYVKPMAARSRRDLEPLISEATAGSMTYVKPMAARSEPDLEPLMSEATARSVTYVKPIAANAGS
ncbi:hypothetical protein MMC14_007363 [Varicellaria rhodocarpa]|nr:hypothetical protein [Varicellaria rhodocarpa]